jgi:hypothetical protein
MLLLLLQTLPLELLDPSAETESSMLVKLAILASPLLLELNAAHLFAHSFLLDLSAQPTSLVLAELNQDAEPEGMS